MALKGMDSTAQVKGFYVWDDNLFITWQLISFEFLILLSKSYWLIFLH